MIEQHMDHVTHGEYWDFMRDAWQGQSKIVHEAVNCHDKFYLHKRESMSDKNFGFYARSGRYPELVSRLLRMSVERTILREPTNMETLELLTTEPEKFLRWALTQTGLVGGCGMALSFDKDRTRIASYNVENVVNWSEKSVAFDDAVVMRDEFGFHSDVERIQVVYHQKNKGTIDQGVFMTSIKEDDVEERAVVNRAGKLMKQLPAMRIGIDNKPLFYSLAQSALKYYQVSAHRNYVLHQIVPQPVLTLPPSESQEAFEMSQLYSDGNIDYGIGTFMKLPYGAKFEIVSPVVRQIGEMRQELVLIKDEMVIQGAQPYFQKAGQVNTLNDASIRMHTDDQIMTFADVSVNVENAINKLIKAKSEYDGIEYGQFRFQQVDYSPDDIKDYVDAYVGSYDKITGKPFDPDLTAAVEEELAQRGIDETRGNRGEREDLLT